MKTIGPIGPIGPIGIVFLVAKLHLATGLSSKLRFSCCVLVVGYSCMAAGDLYVKSKLFPVGPNPCAVAVKDLNGDNLGDIVTADRGQLADAREERPANDELSILMARAVLDYERLSPCLKTDFGPYAIALANMDSLKWPDIVVACFQSVRNKDICIFLNNKQEGIFEPRVFRAPDERLQYCRQADSDGTPLFMKPGFTSLAVADINGDGLRDVAATGWSSDVIAIFWGKLDTCLADEPAYIPAPGGPRDLKLADLDGDGLLDMAAVMYATGEAAFWKGDGKGGFTEVTRFPTRGALPTRIEVADMNRDALPDVAISHCYNDDSIVIFYGDGPFKFSVAQELLLGENRALLEEEIRDMAVADLNGDGRMDIAAACYASSCVRIEINASEGDGGIQKFRKELYTFEEGKPRALGLGDVNNDGQPDLAVALWQANAVCLLVCQTKPAPPPAPPATPAGKSTKPAKQEKTGKK